MYKKKRDRFDSFPIITVMQREKHNGRWFAVVVVVRPSFVR